MLSSSRVWIWIWWSLLVALLTTTTVTTTTASTASPSRRRARLWGRSSSLADKNNATSVDPEEGARDDNDDGVDDGDSSSGGFFSQFRFQQQQKSNGEPTDEGKNDQKLEKGEAEKSNEKNQEAEESSKANESTSSREKSVSDRKKGRGPFGFFKPMDEVKKSKKEKEDDTSDVEEQEIIATVDTDQKGKDAAVDADEKGEEDETGETDKVEDSEDENDDSTTPAPNNTTQAADPALTSTTRPRVFVYKAGPVPDTSSPLARPMPARYGRGPPSQSSPFAPQIDHQALLAATVISVVNAASRLWIIAWIAKRLSAEDELLAPEQHFRWECLNDRYSKDETVLQNILTKPPLGFSRLRWGGYLKKLRPKKHFIAPKGPVLPTKSVVVVDITPSGFIEIPYLTDVVNFLVASHSKTHFGTDPEIVLLVESPGGGVSLFGLAAAQVGRLKQMGLNVTICVDAVAASGGYMIATQATKLIGAPFAQLGSIGVMSEGLNFNSLLTKHGVKPMILKAGDQKNRLSAFGQVTDEDLKVETKHLEKIHEAFVEMCLSERPALDPSICDGTVMVAAQGFEHGLVDRVLTSEEYIWECIQDGAHVLKLHKASPRAHPHYFLFRALDVLPHLKQKLQQLDTGKLLSMAIQGSAFVGMVLRAIR